MASKVLRCKIVISHSEKPSLPRERTEILCELTYLQRKFMEWLVVASHREAKTTGPVVDLIILGD